MTTRYAFMEQELASLKDMSEGECVEWYGENRAEVGLEIIDIITWETSWLFTNYTDVEKIDSLIDIRKHYGEYLPTGMWIKHIEKATCTKLCK